MRRKIARGPIPDLCREKAQLEVDDLSQLRSRRRGRRLRMRVDGGGGLMTEVTL